MWEGREWKVREREGGRGGRHTPEKTAGATHPKTTQRQPEAAQPNAYAKFKAIRSRKRAPGWAERAIAMFKIKNLVRKANFEVWNESGL